MKILFWPDGCWCLEKDLFEMSYKSDDYGTITLDDENSYEDHQIDAMVREATEAWSCESEPEDLDPYDQKDGSLK